MGSKDIQINIFGLTKQDKKVLIDVWDFIRRDIERNGVAIFITYFMDYPEHKKYFNFQQYDPRHLAENPHLKRHAFKVVRKLTFCVDNINDPDRVVRAVGELSDNHRPRKITQLAYDDFRRSFLKTMRNQYDDRFTMDMAECLNKFLQCVFEAIINDSFCMCRVDSPGSSNRNVK